MLQDLTKIHGNHTKIDNIQQLTAGWEADIYAYNLKDKKSVKNLVIRLLQGESADTKMRVEQNCMQGLFNLGYPVPQVYLSADSQNSPFGTAYLVMDAIPGEVYGNQLRNANEITRRSIFERFARLVADLHQLKWQSQFQSPYDDNGEVPTSFIQYRTSEFRQLCEQVIPEFLPLADWFDQHHLETPTRQLVPIHGDFHPWNVLHTPDDKLVVIDWGNFELGDVHYDVMWTWLLLTNRYHPTWGDEFIDIYQQVTNDDLPYKDFYRVAALVRRVVSIYNSLKFGAETMGLRAESQAQLIQEIPEVRWMLVQIAHYTNIQLPEVEHFLDEFSAD